MVVQHGWYMGTWGGTATKNDKPYFSLGFFPTLEATFFNFNDFFF